MRVRVRTAIVKVTTRDVGFGDQFSWLRVAIAIYIYISTQSKAQFLTGITDNMLRGAVWNCHRLGQLVPDLVHLEGLGFSSRRAENKLESPKPCPAPKPHPDLIWDSRDVGIVLSYIILYNIKMYYFCYPIL